MNNQVNYSNKQNRDTSKLITLTAFIIGYALIDHLNSNEQNAVGNFFMLIGQTLCTCGSENFRRDWKNTNNPVNNQNGNSMNSSYNIEDDSVDMLKRVRDVFSEEIDKLN